MSERILNVKVGEGIETGLAHAAQVMEALDRDEGRTLFWRWFC